MNHRMILALSAAAVLLSAAPLSAQSKWQVPDQFKNFVGYVREPIFAEVKEDPALPRVLLIGDSISMYYTPEVRNLLAGKANVYRIPDNGSSTRYGLEKIDYWLGDGHWAVIHFNFGLHDLRIMPATGKEQVSIKGYDRNLRQLVKRLQSTGAKLIWASTTPVPQGAERRNESDVIAYNAVARKIMEENHIPIDDLHALVEAHKAEIDRWQYPANVHYRAEGATEMAAEVVKCIQAALGK